MTQARSFRLTPAGGFTNLYSFSPSGAGVISTNGAVPNALVLGSDGAFYGTTQQGGLDNAGTFFKFTVAGGFTQIIFVQWQAPGNNPITPNSALVQGASGNFFGTSAYGGSQGGGSIFEITTTAARTVLHSFPQLNAGAGAALTLGSGRQFLWNDRSQRIERRRHILRVTPSGDFGAYSFSPLNTNSANADGANPSAASDRRQRRQPLRDLRRRRNEWFRRHLPSLRLPIFIPPFFLAATNPSPALTNTSGRRFHHSVQPRPRVCALELSMVEEWHQSDGWRRHLRFPTSTLIINPVFSRDVGSYALVISNTWGALTSSVTVLTVEPPGIFISSPLPNAATSSPLFAGTAGNAPLFTNFDPGEVRLTNVVFSITTSSTVQTSPVWPRSPPALAVSPIGRSRSTPFPGSNILSVQSVDVSGNISPVASLTFFYEVPARLAVLTTGSGTGIFSVTNGAMLNIGENYSITVSPSSSVFSNWVSGGVISYNPTLPFIMQSNLVLTADFLARQPPAVFISSPTANARTNSPVFKGTATSSPLLPGVNSNNVRLTNVVYWLTNASGSIISGTAVLAGGGSVSNWMITNVVPSPGTNTLAVQSRDISGGLSLVVSQTFFYKVPSLFTLHTNGTGTGTFTATAAVAGDTLPTNGAMLNLDEYYTITAKPDQFSTFSKWTGSAGNITTPTVSFVMQSGYSLTAVFTAVPPIVAISSPTANLRTAAPVMSGTASGHLRLTNVSYSLAGSFTGFVSNGFAALTGSAGTVSNWSIPIVPQPGTNTLTVRCVDAAGNASAAVSRTFFYKVPAKLGVLQAGSGNGAFKGAASIPGDILPTNGAMLNLGEGYAVTAVPGASSLFSNWVSAAGITVTPVLPFIMQSNLVLTANFVSNFFPAAAGTYNGLFFPANAVAKETSGMLYNLVLMGSGAFSGKFLMPGTTNYPFSTNFDVSGHAAFSAGKLQVDLTLDRETPQINGTVSSSQWTANLTADLASNTLPSAQYTMLFSPSANVPVVSPPGDGYALVTNFAGMVTLSGALADGTSYNQTVPVSKAGNLPVYASLYTNAANTNAGLLLGWINLTNLQAAPPANALAWIKKSSRSSALYTNGFTNILSVQGALWTNPPLKTSAISLTNGQLVISNTGLFLDFTNIVVSNNTLTNLGVLPTNSMTGLINPKTGLLNLTFANGNGHATNSAFGAILQNTTNAGGFFLTSTNAGFLNLQP